MKNILVLRHCLSRLTKFNQVLYSFVVKRLYWTDPHIYEIDVDVKVINGNLVKTTPIVFHPDEGGQMADVGSIGGVNVLKVEVCDNDIVLTLDKPLFEGVHKAVIDREHRIDMSTQHTAQHIISAIAERSLSAQTFGFRIGTKTSTLDIKCQLNWDQSNILETEANRVVMQNIKILTTFGSAPEGLRIREDLLPQKGDELRVVSIGNLDVSACCGTHTTTTGQVGSIKIVDLESHKSGTRITYVAGIRTICWTQNETSILRELRTMATCKDDELPSTFKRFSENINASQKEILHLWEKILPQEIESADIFEVEGIKFGVLKTNAPNKFLSKLTSILADKTSGVSIVLAGTSICVNSKLVSAKDILSRIITVVGGKGGGSTQSASGQFLEFVELTKIKEIFLKP